MVFYESPYRLVKTLEQFVEAYGQDRRCSVTREISKVHEETVRGTLAEVAGHFKSNEPRGEIVIVVEGCPAVKGKEKKKEYKPKQEEINV